MKSAVAETYLDEHNNEEKENKFCKLEEADGKMFLNQHHRHLNIASYNDD